MGSSAQRPIRRRLEGHANDFLGKAKRVRVALQASAIVLPVIIAVAKFVEASLPNPYKVAPITVQIVLLIVAALCAVLVLLTDKSALVLMADAREAVDEAENKAEEISELEAENDFLQDEISKQVQVSITVDVMRQAIDSALLSDDVSDIENEMVALLDLLVASKGRLFGMGDEQWNFSIYIWDVSAQSLVCKACRRPTKADEDGAHRSWCPGEGHVGKAFSNKRSIIVADALDPNVRGFFDAPVEKRSPEDDDATKYRSIAAIPIALAGADREAEPLGVVVATSDQVGRFRPREDGTEDDAVRPIRHLSNTLATLLTLNNLSRRE